MSPEIRIMSISTKKGDCGLTDTIYGRETKDHPSVELNGIFDEFQAGLGVIAARLGKGQNEDFLKLELKISNLMSHVYLGMELGESLEMEKIREKMTTEEINDFVRLCDEGIEVSKFMDLKYTDQGYSEYFLDLKKKLSDKNNSRISFGEVDFKTDIENSFNGFFDSIEKSMECMDDNEFGEELERIKENVGDVLSVTRNGENGFDFIDRLEELEILENKLESYNSGMANGFKVFGDGNLTEAYLNLSRTKIRRIERRSVKWNKENNQKLLKTGVLAYLNRTSDVLYLMSLLKK